MHAMRSRARNRRARTWVVTMVLLAACSTVPYTNRSQLMLLSQKEELQLGVAAYQQVLSQAKVDHDPKAMNIVERVGQRIAQAADKPDFQWQFTVIQDDKMVNAFCLPGGKVAVYTGIFPVAQDEAGLAAVVGHEVAHALARHGAERMSQGVLLQLGSAGVAAALGGGGSDPATTRAIMGALGLGAQVGVILPFSRSQESEADHIGLILMAKAGYDPQAALHLWERMEKVGKAGGAPPEFLTTHPAYGTRQQQIREWLPEALGYYKPDPSLVIEKLPGVENTA